MTEIRAELVAVVTDVVAEVGRRVSPGDLLLMLESMKMEIPVFAEAAGVIDQLVVARGQSVQEGAVLAVLTPFHAGPPAQGEPR